MRILLNGLTQRPGGGLVVLEALARGLLDASNDICVDFISFSTTSCDALNRIGSDRLGVLQPKRSWGSIENFMLSRHVARALKSTQSDLIIGLNHFVPGCTVPQIIYHVNLSRFVRKAGSFGIEEMLHRLRDWSSLTALKRASANVFESQYVFMAAKSRYPIAINNPGVIYIGVDDRSVVPRDLRNRDAIEPIIAVVTSPHAHKRNYFLVPILVELRKRALLTDWKIRLFGGLDSDVWQDLKTVAAKHGVLEYIEFMGYRSREEVEATLDVATCLLSTSAVESFCMVALESMARGCPAIVSQDTAMPESVGESGLVVDVTNASEVADVIERLYEEASFRQEYSQKGIQHVGSMTWSTSGKRFSELATSLMIKA